MSEDKGKSGGNSQQKRGSLGNNGQFQRGEGKLCSNTLPTYQAPPPPKKDSSK